MMNFIKFDEEEEDIEDVQTQDPQDEQIGQLNDKIIDIDNDFYPYCIVWSAIPFISFLLPWIGHAAICCSKGIIHDFSKDFKINVSKITYSYKNKLLLFLQQIDVVPYGSPLKQFELYNKWHLQIYETRHKRHKARCL